jgi:serine/threonine protein kinase/Flp pilus assembly protein TadD
MVALPRVELSSPQEPAQAVSNSEAVPRGLGPYTAFVPHARGGLGEVLKATDTDLNRIVAVKRLQDCHANDDASQRRFLLEAEITARLEHPGVVPVYALLQDHSRRPCYAMRFIEGQTLAEAITAYHAGPPDPVAFRRLLQCFLQMCQTVAYAHSRGVIHRDLKPANVMLGRFGETLVVDWGLAKVVGRPDEIRAASTETTLQPADAASSGHETAFGSAIGTPAFMSPEQAAGRWDVVHTASDIYSLGAVLYILLVGRPPLTKGNWPELLQKIQRGDFPRPRQVQADVPRALEAVCLQAMALEPRDRYASAQALAADVERWLADEPVSAWRESVWVKGSRWMRRHKTLVSATAVLLVSVLAAAAAGLVLLDHANQEIAAERNAARAAAEQAQAVNEFLTVDLLGQADPDVNDRTKKVTVEELLYKAARKIAGNPKFADQPAVEATLRLTIGKTFYKLGNFPEAEKHLRRALELRRQALGPDDPRTLAAQEALADFWNVGPGRFAEAQVLARQTWEARARVLGQEHRDTLDSLDTYATALNSSGRFAEASARHQECLATRRRVLGPDHPDTIVSINNLAIVLLDQGKWAQALPLLREGVDMLARRSQGADYAMSVFNLAIALYMRGDLEEADRVLQENVNRSTEQFGADHPVTDRSCGLLFRVWMDQGRLEAAVSLAQEVVARRQRIYPADHGLTGIAQVELGRALVLLGRDAAANDALAEVLTSYAKKPPRPQYMIAWAECWRGASLTGLGRYEEAQPMLLAAERELRERPDLPPRHYQGVVEQLVKLYDAWRGCCGNPRRPEEAAKWRKHLDQVRGH